MPRGRDIQRSRTRRPAAGLPRAPPDTGLTARHSTCCRPTSSSYLRDHLDDIDELAVITSGETDIPWELVYVWAADAGEDPDGRGFLGRAGLVRWVYNTGHPTELSVRKGRGPLPHPRVRRPGLVLDRSPAGDDVPRSPSAPPPSTRRTRPAGRADHEREGRPVPLRRSRAQQRRARCRPSGRWSSADYRRGAATGGGRRPLAHLLQPRGPAPLTARQPAPVRGTRAARVPQRVPDRRGPLHALRGGRVRGDLPARRRGRLRRLPVVGRRPARPGVRRGVLPRARHRSHDLPGHARRAPGRPRGR